MGLHTCNERLLSASGSEINQHFQQPEPLSNPPGFSQQKKTAKAAVFRYRLVTVSA